MYRQHEFPIKYAIPCFNIRAIDQLDAYIGGTEHYAGGMQWLSKVHTNMAT